MRGINADGVGISLATAGDGFVTGKPERRPRQHGINRFRKLAENFLMRRLPMKPVIKCGTRIPA